MSQTQIQSPELLNKLAEWRAKSADGTITLEEMREAIKTLRGNRVAASAAAKAGTKRSSSTAKVSAASAADLMKQLEGL